MKNEQRAAQFWSVLVLAARFQKILSYKTMQQVTGIHRRGQANTLDLIQNYCIAKKLPPLTSIVVAEDTGLPSTGYKATATPTETFAAQNRTFTFDWLRCEVPTSEVLAKFKTKKG